jgi:hypothetical protein
MTREEANAVASNYVAAMEKRSGVALIIVDELTMERDFGWVYFYNSKLFIETGDPAYAGGGNAPIIIDRVSGQLHETGTARATEYYIAEFEKRWAGSRH